MFVISHDSISSNCGKNNFFISHDFIFTTCDTPWVSVEVFKAPLQQLGFLHFFVCTALSLLHLHTTIWSFFYIQRPLLFGCWERDRGVTWLLLSSRLRMRLLILYYSSHFPFIFPSIISGLFSQ